MVTVINPSSITTGDVQEVKVDLTKFDVAKKVVAEANTALKAHIVIHSKEQQTNAMALVKDANAVVKAIENKRKKLVGPFNGAVKDINGYAKQLSEELERNIDTVKKALLEFHKEEEKRALQARATQRQAYLMQLGFVYVDGNDEYVRLHIGRMTGNELMNYDDKSFKHITDGFATAIENRSRQEAAQAMEEKELVDLFGDNSQKEAVAETVKAAETPVAAYAPPVTQALEALKGVTKTWAFEIENDKLVPRDYLMVDEKAIRQAIRDGVRTIPGVRIYQEESLRVR